MSKNNAESVVFIAGGSVTGTTIFQTVGGVGFVGSFGGVGLGLTPFVLGGGLTGAAVYGAVQGVQNNDPIALGALGLGVLGGTVVSATVGGVGMGIGGTAIGLGWGAMAFSGGVVGLGLYGLGKMFLDEAPKESFATTFERLETKVSSQEFYIEAMLELDPTLRELAFEQKMRELEIEEELKELKAKFFPQGNSFKKNNQVNKVAQEYKKDSFQELEIEAELRELKAKIKEQKESKKENNQGQKKEIKTNAIINFNWKIINNLKGHFKEINAFAVSQENLLISVSNDRSIKIWDIVTGKNITNFFGLPQEVVSVAVSPDNNTIIVGDFDSKITAFNLKTKSYIKTYFDHNNISHKGVVYGLNFNSTGNEFISVSADKTLKLWDTKTGLLKRIFNGHSKEVMSAIFAPNNNYIISGSRDKTIRIWSRNNCVTPPIILTGHLASVNVVKITPNGEIIVSGSSDNTIKLWSLKTGKLINTLIGHTQGIFDLNISPDGEFLLSGSGDNTVKIWSLKTGKLIDSLEGKYPVIFSKDGKFLITNSDNNVIKIWQKLNYSYSENSSININGNWWEILGVSFNASKQEIKIARNQLIKKYHPDYNNSPEAKIIMQAINKAYKIAINT